jgi:L-threonylcarbamoyladenylate synthase
VKKGRLVDATEAADIVKAGGVVAYPTETFYGLGADPRNEDAIERVFQIKGRDRGKPVSILVRDENELSRWVRNVGQTHRALMRKFWPGPLTLVFLARKSVSNALTAGTGKIAVRISPQKDARELLKRAGGAITTTSANLSGLTAHSDASGVMKELGGRADGILKGPRLKASKGSTIVDATQGRIKLIREGDIPFDKIKKEIT